MGARVDQTDIFVHLDWMKDATHSHALSVAAIKQVIDAFKNAPYTSHAGVKGIRLHVDAGPSSVMNLETRQTWRALSRAKAITEGKIPPAVLGFSALSTASSDAEIDTQLSVLLGTISHLLGTYVVRSVADEGDRGGRVKDVRCECNFGASNGDAEFDCIYACGDVCGGCSEEGGGVKGRRGGR